MLPNRPKNNVPPKSLSQPRKFHPEPQKAFRRKQQREAQKAALAEMQRKRGFFNRLRRFIFHPLLVLPTLLIVCGICLGLVYYWMEFSVQIDRLLAGEIFTRRAGIYSAPKTLRTGEEISLDELITHLRGANYIPAEAQAEESRGRYQTAKDFVEIKPNADAEIDGVQRFHNLRVKFSKDGKTVAQIFNLDTNAPVPNALLEPRRLSSIAAVERERRQTISYKDLPDTLKRAVVVTEDRTFFEHLGINFRGIARAAYRRYEKGDQDNSPIARQGGSSITQQLIKNLVLSPEETLQRKATEAYMAVILETRLSKEEIFTLYANQIYLGQYAGFSINGVGEAANAYFNKDVSALTLPESAFIASIIRSPNRYNPLRKPEIAVERRNQVLTSMLEAGAISPADFEQAKATPLKLVPPQARTDLYDLPYFTEYAQEEVSNYVQESDALKHLRIYTTIDLDLQKAAYNALTKNLNRIEKYFPKEPKGNLQGALIALNPKTGEIVAMVGGRDYLQSQFNRATDAKRQPGSVFKPFVYAAAINTAYDPSPRVITAASMFKDAKKTFFVGSDTYEPNNYGDFFSNQEITLRDALVKSKNTITVDLGIELNIGKVMNLAARAGFPRVPKAYPSMALGTAEATPLQVAQAYTSFANLGQTASPLSVSRITTGEGKTIYQPETEKKEVLKPDVAYIMNDIMKDVINRGTATDAQRWGLRNSKGHGIAGKTGTSRDGWFAGFTPNLVCVVYVGFDDNKDLGMKGSDSALPIWADFMREALNLHPEWNTDWQEPITIQKAEIDTRDGRTIREVSPYSPEFSAENKPLSEEEKQKAQLADAPLDEYGNPIVGKLEAQEAVDIPKDFRRIELFVGGSIPTRATDKPSPLEDLPAPEANVVTAEAPTPYPNATFTPTPPPLNVDITKSRPKEDHSSDSNPPDAPRDDFSVILMIDPTTNRIAAPTCPQMKPVKFKQGTEPRAVCSPEFHRASSAPRDNLPSSERNVQP